VGEEEKRCVGKFPSWEGLGVGLLRVCCMLQVEWEKRRVGEGEKS